MIIFKKDFFVLAISILELSDTFFLFFEDYSVKMTYICPIIKICLFVKSIKV